MCGICGFVDPAAAPADRGAAIRRMTGTLAHRGPDGDGLWSDDGSGVALGHRRLAIIDVSPTGRQPMLSHDGRFVLTYNGEIYNYRDLRQELEAAGTRFRGTSDTEVMLEAFVHWGVAATCRRLNGIFAFALWDRREHVLFLGRDPIGVKPLYWSLIGNALVFGSELKALAAHPAWRPSVDRDALAAFFRYAYVPAPHTIYRDVQKLAPGTLLTHRGHGAPEIATFWNARTVAGEAMADRLGTGDEQATDRLEALLRDAVARQMISDVPLGALLSGGIDSSTVVALMQTQSATPVRTFTIGFAEPGYDEAEHARAVAAHLGTEHNELYVEPSTARDLVPEIPAWFDEPFADPSQLPTYLVSGMARRHVTVALSGDGGDEVFAGYRRYALGDMLRRRVLRLPRHLRQAAARLLRAPSPARWDRLMAMLPSARQIPQFGDKVHKLAQVLALPGETALYRRLLSQCDDPEAYVVGGHEAAGPLDDAALERDFASFIERMQYIDTVTYLPDDILTKVDRTSMAHGLEVRVPLLDPRVVSFGWRLPPAMRVRNGCGKWLLRQVLYRHVPSALVDRPKMGFGVPIDAWLRGPLRDWAEDLLDERQLREEGLLHAPALRALWREHLSGRRNWQYILWCALMFQEWKRRWLDGLRLPQPAPTAFVP